MPPPRPANGDTIYIIHTHLDPLLIRCPCWPASTANQSGPVTLTFDLESGVRVTCDVGYTVPILVFLGLSVLDLDPMYATDRQT